MPIFKKSAAATAIAFGVLALSPGGALGEKPEEVPTERNFLPASGNDLLELIEGCEDKSCMSYVYGVIQGTSVYAIIADNPSPFCPSSSIDGDDIQSAIIDTITSTPELHEAPAALSILTAFSRHWPCISADKAEEMQAGGAMVPVSFDFLDELTDSMGHALDLGDPDAASNRTLVVFHDQNCPHCRRFRSEVETLVERGWRVKIYPVAVTSEESTGYGAVEIALRGISEEAGLALYRQDPANIADITLAMKIAERAGVPTKDILTAIASSGAYEAVQNNTRLFFGMGAKGTPAWILGNSLFSGALPARAIEDLADTFEGEEEEHDFYSELNPEDRVEEATLGKNERQGEIEADLDAIEATPRSDQQSNPATDQADQADIAATPMTPDQEITETATDIEDALLEGIPLRSVADISRPATKDGAEDDAVIPEQDQGSGG